MSWTGTRNMFGLLQQRGKHLNKTGFSDFNALVVYCIRFVYPLYASLGSAPQLLLLRAACQSGLSEEQPVESFRGSFTQCRSMDGRSYLPSWFIMAYIFVFERVKHKKCQNSEMTPARCSSHFAEQKPCASVKSTFPCKIFLYASIQWPSLSFVIRPFTTHDFCFAQGFSFHFNKLILLWPSWVATPARQNPKSLPQLSIISQSPLTRSMLRLARPCWTAQTWARRWVGPANCRMANVLWDSNTILLDSFFQQICIGPSCNLTLYLPLASVVRASMKGSALSILFFSVVTLPSTPKHTRRKPLTSLETAGLGPHLWQRLFRKRRWCSIHQRRRGQLQDALETVESFQPFRKRRKKKTSQLVSDCVLPCKKWNINEVKSNLGNIFLTVLAKTSTMRHKPLTRLRPQATRKTQRKVLGGTTMFLNYSGTKSPNQGEQQFFLN